ncbi:dihydrodipicolinate synthase family protein [Staphylococcus nepalensis]|jgi:4-hydroxy-tetrahydrodipicolinate synthase|nr:dihydrodipicolinate synthase family protein [Staphylococcus nepalensis]MBO1221843.1 dihydrodipicolinate synthase family protein [Staphylococcus nepalensis]
MVQGVYPPIITIFNEEGNIDYEANKKQTDFLIYKGIDGIAYLGTSGEFSSLTIEERKKYLEEMVKYVNKRVKIIAGVGDTSIINTKELISFCEYLQVDSILLVPPYFNKNNDEMIIEYYTYLANITNLPIILYNIPDLSGYNFSYEIVKTLIEKNSNIKGIKESLDSITHLKEMINIKSIDPEFKVFCAYENLAKGALLAGVDGFINATANFAPEYTVNTYQYFISNDEEKFLYNANKMNEAMKIYDLSNPLYLACKQACYLRVIKRDCYERLPAVNLNDESKKKIEKKLEEIGITDLDF